MVEIMTNYKRPERRKEVGGGPRIVEASGYIPTKVQVENMLIAGQRLNEYRREQYDFTGDSDIPDDVTPDPTRSPEFDLADATRIGRAANERLNKANKEIEASKKKLEVQDKPEEDKTSSGEA